MITGSIVALVTPMQQQNRSIDWSALEKLVSWHIEQGTDAIVAVGTTGESATLNVTEHARVIEFVVDKADGKIPIIAGTGPMPLMKLYILPRPQKRWEPTLVC